MLMTMMKIIFARDVDYFGAHKKTPERINPELRPNQTVPTSTNAISGFNPRFFWISSTRIIPGKGNSTWSVEGLIFVEETT